MTETALCCRERPEGGLDGACTWPETDCYQKGPAMPNPSAPSTIPPGTPPPKITVEVWDGADQYPNAKVADVVRINDTWHVVAVIDD